ncbi:MAG: T9SS type A sorting domain-containing protein, partial [Flammeovirgaceae bacterium]|nr:T9SS type A sorting domain-containing protein [Flammeovirgaceae bacterium]MDW8288921.1 T9SS type A sorting domain-containing protein [Flammeovirgaceae bacterium]
FERVGWVKGVGESSVLQSYEYREQYVKAAYYRLRQEDTTGEFVYSKAVYVEAADNETSIAIYPNPFVKELHIEVGSQWQMGEIAIYNLQGVQLRQHPLNVANHRYTILLDDLPQGTYIVRVQGQGNGCTKTIVKQ